MFQELVRWDEGAPQLVKVKEEEEGWMALYLRLTYFTYIYPSTRFAQV